jgi:hypothetical protein
MGIHEKVTHAIGRRVEASSQSSKERRREGMEWVTNPTANIKIKIKNKDKCVTYRFGCTCLADTHSLIETNMR